MKRCKCGGQVFPETFGGMAVYTQPPRSKLRHYRCKCSKCGKITVRKLKGNWDTSTNEGAPHPKKKAKIRDITVSVTRGSVRVNSAVVLLKTENVVWVSLDCLSKYPEIDSIGGSERECCIYLGATSRTLRACRSKPPTKVSINLRGERWTVFANAGRYSVEMVCLRRPCTRGRDVMREVQP